MCLTYNRFGKFFCSAQGRGATTLCARKKSTLPPALSEAYAKAHDTAMWAAVERLLGALPGSASEIDMAKQLSTLPLRLGGLGLRSAERMAPAAYWASWADALHMIDVRTPAAAAVFMDALATGAAPSGAA